MVASDRVSANVPAPTPAMIAMITPEPCGKSAVSRATPPPTTAATIPGRLLMLSSINDGDIWVENVEGEMEISNVNDNITLINTMSGTLMGPDGVVEKFGVRAEVEGKVCASATILCADRPA